MKKMKNKLNTQYAILNRPRQRSRRAFFSLCLLTIAIFYITAIPNTANATTYYVATDGNNSAVGDITHPWLTITYALGASSPVVAGDTIYVRGGTYREQVKVYKFGATDNWITVKGYTGETAVLDGTEAVTGWTQAQSNDSYLTVLGVVNPHYSNIYWTRVLASVFPTNLSDTILFDDRVMCRIAGDPDQSEGFGEEPLEFRNVSAASNGQKAYLIDTTLTQVDDYWNGAIVRIMQYAANSNVEQGTVADWVHNDSKAIFDSNLTYSITYSGSHIDSYHFINHPHILDSAGEFYVSAIEDVNGTNYRRIYYWPSVVGNLTSKMAMATRDDTFWRVLGGQAWYLSIEDLTIFGTKDKGIVFHGTSGSYGSYVTVKNCTITDCGGDGIDFTYMNYTRAEGNYIRRCNDHGIMGNDVDHCVFKTNNVDDTKHTNITFFDATNSMLINNTVYGIRGGHGNGTTVYGVAGLCEDVLVAGNQYYNTNMALQNIRNLTAFANLFRGDESNPYLAITVWSGRSDGNQVWINNTAPISTTYALQLYQEGTGYSEDLPKHYVINNVFHGMAKDWAENWDSYDPNKVRVEDRTYNAYTYYGWQQDSFGWSLKTGEQDLRSTSLATMFVNPSYPTGNYLPIKDGPLTGTGKNAQGILTNLGIIAKFPEYDFSKDLAGNLWNSNPSIGCYEYGATAFLYGDVNVDAKVTPYDAALAAHIAVGLAHPDIKQPEAAEVDGIGSVSANDASLIAQRAVGLIDKFPVE